MSNKISLSVRTFEGREIQIQVNTTDKILDVKRQIQEKEDIRPDLQRLVFGQKILKNSQTLLQCGIGEDSVLHLVLRSPEMSNIVAGGHGLGSAANEFCFPYGIAVDDNETVVVADWGNHRIMQWKVGEKVGRIIAGGQGQGCALNQLCCPTDVVIDKQTNSLIICDRGNNRVLIWSREQSVTHGEVLLGNISCWGLAMDHERNLYITDTDRHVVIRYRMGDSNGVVVAGGHGRGYGLNQLNEPTYIFVDQKQTIYISDTRNNRIMKWNKGATEGSILALRSSRGLFVDTSETLYLADYGNHKLIRWPKGASQGVPIPIGDAMEEGKPAYSPWGVCSDQQGLLYVTDHAGQRVQRFFIGEIE